MARGGYRQGAGRKKEYGEPVKKILLGLPESVLEQLDHYASGKKLSRPKAVADLLQQAQKQHGRMSVLDELKSLKTDLHKSKTVSG